jgi:hypothetical protein
VAAQRLRVRNTYVREEHSTAGKSGLSARRSVPMADRLAGELDRWSQGTIAEIIRNGKGCAGTGGAWQVEPDSTTDTPRALALFDSMLTWRPDAITGGAEMLDYPVGWRSVSDHNGMNSAFAELVVSFRYNRDARGGGQRISKCPGLPRFGRVRREREAAVSVARAIDRGNVRSAGALPAGRPLDRAGRRRRATGDGVGTDLVTPKAPSPEALRAAGWERDGRFPLAGTDATIEAWSRGRQWQEIRVERGGDRRVWDRGEFDDVAGGGGGSGC